jgi:hypothetical protein
VKLTSRERASIEVFSKERRRASPLSEVPRVAGEQGGVGNCFLRRARRAEGVGVIAWLVDVERDFCDLRDS